MEGIPDSHLYYPGSVDKQGAGVEHEGNELGDVCVSVCERVQDENNRVRSPDSFIAPAHVLKCLLGRFMLTQ